MNCILRILVIGIVVLTATPARAGSVEIIRNVSYYDGADRDPVRHRLDIYLPKGVTKFPTVVFYHGGTWMMGSKDGFLGIPGHRAVDHGKFFAENGIAAVFCNYRLSPQVKYPEHVIDSARAFAWVRRNIAEYGGDADQLFVMGHSAGGHLASLLATDPKYLMTEGLTPSMIRGAISVSGALILSADLVATNGEMKKASSPAFLSHVFGKDPETYRQASPMLHVHSGLPPFLVAYADGDMLSLPAQAVAFSDAVAAKDNVVHKLLVTGRNHQSILKSSIQPDDPLGVAILEFVRTGKP